jgi:DNA-binding response OmpR family regulator
MSTNIAIIDDEEDIVELVKVHLEKNNFKTTCYYDANSFLSSLHRQIPDLIVLDLMLPDLNGIEVCKQLRIEEKWKKIYVIMLTAKQDEIDKILGLEIGADDYVTKPFSPRELVARVKAVLRRNESQETEISTYININDLIYIDLQKMEVFNHDNKRIKLTATEFKILQILSEKKGWVYSRDKLLNKIWGEEKFVIDRTIDVHIRNLREKLGKAGELIINVRGFGYKLDV